jgi:hypothetical protein
MNDQEIKAFDIAVRIVKPTSKDISRDERGNIYISRELYDTFINIVRLFQGKLGDEKILDGDAKIYSALANESQ